MSFDCIFSDKVPYFSSDNQKHYFALFVHHLSLQIPISMLLLDIYIFFLRHSMNSSNTACTKHKIFNEANTVLFFFFLLNKKCLLNSNTASFRIVQLWCCNVGLTPQNQGHNPGIKAVIRPFHNDMCETLFYLGLKQILKAPNPGLSAV